MTMKDLSANIIVNALNKNLGTSTEALYKVKKIIEHEAIRQ